MHKILSNKKAIVLFLFPTVLLISIFVVVPICMSVYYSMLNWDGIGKGTFIGLQNYIDMISDTRFTSSIKNSLLYAAFSLFLQLPFSLLLAIVVANVTRGEKFYRTTFFIPVIISGVVIGQLWQGQDWLGQENTALLAAFVPNLWQYIGYHMLIMYAGIKSISPDINEAAKIDGANKIQTAFRITIPLLKPILQVCITFSLIGALKIFDLIYVLTGGGPFFSTEVPTIYMYKTVFDSFNYGYGSAISIFVILECLILTVVLRLFFREKGETS